LTTLANIIGAGVAIGAVKRNILTLTVLTNIHRAIIGIIAVYSSEVA